jgi:CheY-like chemotaxis protein
MMNRKAVILCVDDEENPLALRQCVLQTAGYKVLIARSGKEALELAAEHKLDLILTDHLMPGMNGTELAQQIKAQYPELPVVLFSGVNDIPIGADFADAFLSKVEGPDALCREIAAVLHEGNGHTSSKALS